MGEENLLNIQLDYIMPQSFLSLSFIPSIELWLMFTDPTITIYHQQSYLLNEHKWSWKHPVETFDVSCVLTSFVWQVTSQNSVLGMEDRSFI